MVTKDPLGPPPGQVRTPLLRKVAAIVGASWLILFGLAVAMAGAGAFVLHMVQVARPSLPPESTTRTEVRPTPDVVLAIKSLARLETERFHIERVIDLSDHQTRLWGFVQADDAILLVAVGDVTAGVDLERVAAGDIDVDWASRHVTLRLPQPSVFSASLDEKATRIYSRTTDLLASRHEDLEDRARAEAVRSMEASAVEGGLLDRARRDAEQALSSLLRSLGFADIRIEWKESQ